MVTISTTSFGITKSVWRHGNPNDITTECLFCKSVAERLYALHIRLTENQNSPMELIIARFKKVNMVQTCCGHKRQTLLAQKWELLIKTILTQSFTQFIPNSIILTFIHLKATQVTLCCGIRVMIVTALSLYLPSERFPTFGASEMNNICNLSRTWDVIRPSTLTAGRRSHNCGNRSLLLWQQNGIFLMIFH